MWVFIELVSLEVRICEDFKGKIRVFLVLGRFFMDFNRFDVICGEWIILFDNMIGLYIFV